jgi:adenosylmethionine-8-amino-7-oxononanoate aminotransferase
VSLADRDRRHVWHPFTQEQTAPLPVGIARAKGASLFDESGREILDLAASWWVNVHGHCHPAIARAIAEQAKTLEHVLFAGFTHEPAVRLAEELCAALPRPLDRVFFSDNGSTSVEVALKAAYQYWRNRGENGRTVFLALEGGYHGDTFGAMSVGRSSGFYPAFADLLFEARFFPFAETWLHDEGVAAREEAALDCVARLLDRVGDRTAAVILEPLLQGAAGMRVCRPGFTRRVAEAARARGILVIFDEVLTGLGRTGTLFALSQVGFVPDFVCLSKGLTGGFLPLAATVAREEVYQAFLGPDFSTALAHGHSYTANPLGCAAALASLALFEEERTLERIRRIGDLHRQWLTSLCDLPVVRRPRQIGSVAAFTLGADTGDYGSDIGPRLRARLLDQGLLVRPLGNVVYLMPPACIGEEELKRAQGMVREAVEEMG